ncbi:hypothetical protein OH76DRAFT_1351373 [Lentinus brumalis]|uniref:BTB domain-containing protein n=1 Tax=Lentinus brumalis TaxID=2498619 RepID=A0A371D8T2_9APHY|nr:hypothetical protein OH76DRAFT_1351373 [Polyporus brumalis]
MSGEAPRKRVRLDAEDGKDDHEQSQADSCTADAEFWFDDGNIILEAKSTQFKVYKGPLIEHSPFFRDMLSLPQPQPEDATTSDAPHVVPLAESPEDLRHLLRAIMPSKRIRSFIPPERPFHAISACIRLGHKYQIDGLVEEGLKYLRTFYPDDYFTLEKRRREEAPSTICAIGVVNIARLTGADYLLPVALVECCRLGSDIVEGLRREDDTIESLSTADLGRCFEAKQKLIETRVEAAFDIFDGEPSEDCSAREKDTEHLRELHTDLSQTLSHRLCSPDVLERWWPSLSHYIPPLCAECDGMFRQADRDRQRAIFHHLPELVGVDVEGWKTKNRIPM